MSAVTRGARSAFRNPIRSLAVVLLLGVSVAMALSLLMANQAVKNKSDDLKASSANSLTVTPAGGGMGFQGGGEPLTNDMLAKVKTLANVDSVSAILNINSFRMRFAAGPNGTVSADDSSEDAQPQANISLESSIDAGTLGRRNFGSSDGSSSQATTFKLPVRIIGLSGDSDATGNNYSLTAGGYFSADDVLEAMVGKGIAEKNSLSVGSTFTAYEQTFKVVGIFDAGNEFENDAVVLPLATAQRLSAQTGEISQIIVKPNSLENYDKLKTAITTALGADKVDVTSSAQNVDDALSSLESIHKISIAGVVIAFIAAVVIVLMVMVMIVRERRREIAVLKAIGGSNFKISLQFVAEAVTVTLASVVIGLALALISANKLTSVLVSTNQKSASQQTIGQRGQRTLRLGAGGARAIGRQSDSSLLEDVKTSAGASLILEGLAAVILIGVVGSALPALAIAKVRPAEVMRGE